MNKNHLVRTAFVLAITAGLGSLTGCGDSDGTAASTTTGSVSNPGTPGTAAPAASDDTTTPLTPADLVLTPGAAGPVKVGMTKTAALATGLVVAGSGTAVDGCRVPALGWADGFAPTLDLQLLDDASIASIGVWEEGPRTASGLGVGSTLAEVLADNPRSKPVPAGYGQTGVLVRDQASDGWIGFLFDAAPDTVEDSDTVTFVELTEDEKPGLMRDGC